MQATVLSLFTLKVKRRYIDGGFMKAMMTVGFVGKKAKFANKEIKAEYYLKFQDALPLIIADILRRKKSFLSVTSYLMLILIWPSVMNQVFVCHVQ